MTIDPTLDYPDEAPWPEWDESPFGPPGADRDQPDDDQPGDESGPTSIVAAGLVDWPTFWARVHEPEDWLLEPILARGRGHALIAPAKLGKSLLAVLIDAHLAGGRRFLGRPAGLPITVGYLDYEMTATDLWERLDAAGYGPDDDLSRLHYIFNQGIPSLDTPAGGDALVEYATAHGIEFLVIDSFARAVAGPENDSDTVRAFYRCTGGPLKAAGIGWIRLDNTGHGEKDRARGSSGKTDDVDIEWVASRTDDGIRLKRRASRVAGVPDRVDLHLTTEPLGYRLVARGWAAGTKEAVDLLDELGAPVAISVRDARAVVREAGHKIRNESLSDAVRMRKERADGLG